MSDESSCLDLQVRAVILDYGNVISRPQNRDRLQQMCQLAGLSQDDFRQRYLTHRPDYDRGTITAAEYWSRVLGHGATQLHDSLLEKLVREDVLSWADIDDRMLAWVEGLKDHGFETAMLSNLPKEEAEHFRRHFEWFRHFDYTFLSSELRMVKPESWIYEHVIREVGIPGNQMLFLDDVRENVDAARNTGMNAILYESVERLSEVLQESGHLPLPC